LAVAFSAGLNNFGKLWRAVVTGDLGAIAAAGLIATSAATGALMGAFINRCAKEDADREAILAILRGLASNDQSLSAKLETMLHAQRETNIALSSISTVQIIDDDKGGSRWEGVNGTFYAVGGHAREVIDRRINGKLVLTATEPVYTNWASRLVDKNLEAWNIVFYLSENADFQDYAWLPARKTMFALEEAANHCIRQGLKPNCQKVRLKIVRNARPTLPPSFTFARRTPSGDMEPCGLQYWGHVSTDHHSFASRPQKLAILRGAEFEALQRDCAYEFFCGTEVTWDEMRTILATGSLKGLPPTSQIFSSSDHMGGF
jgi:hypothetical protein